MNLFTKTFAALTLLVALPAQATLVVGDNEWFKVSETTAFSWNDFNQIFDSNGECIIGVTITSPIGGTLVTGDCQLENEDGTVDLSEYTWASNQDVIDMITYGFADIDEAVLIADWDQVLSDGTLDHVLGVDKPSGSDFSFVEAFTRDIFNDANGEIIGAEIYSSTNANPNEEHIYYDYFPKDNKIGGWFFRSTSTTVPEPSVIALFSLGLLGLGFIRRRKSL